MLGTERDGTEGQEIYSGLREVRQQTICFTRSVINGRIEILYAAN